jgi:hypothetical protein
MNTASIRSFLLRRRRNEATPVEHDAAEMGTAFGLDMSYAHGVPEAPAPARPQVARSRWQRWRGVPPVTAK